MTKYHVCTHCLSIHTTLGQRQEREMAEQHHSRGAYRASRGNEATPEAHARAIAAYDYRSELLARQQPAYLLRRASSSDGAPAEARRTVSWAPFGILPGALLVVRAAPAHLRVRLWAGSLIGFAAVSAGVWGSREDSAL